MRKRPGTAVTVSRRRARNGPATAMTVTSDVFMIGCNYWASHAGTAMWREWRPQVVAQDLRRLAAGGLRVLRVFPLWPDFQPLTRLYGYAGGSVELRHGEAPLPEDDVGRAGVDAAALKKFGTLADLAQRYGLKLIVGLVTGWMSGRMFVPPAFEQRNPLTDPEVLMWTVRWVRCFVRRFRHHPAIWGWDLGNECNCMGTVPNRAAAWLWTATVANAIRLEDTGHPILSGMHGLSANAEGPWTIVDQAELNDLLTTHPYPMFTPHTDRDPLNTLRPCLHATAESRLYADVGRRPCLVEELGTLGPLMGSDRVAADYLRTALFSTWAHDCLGLLWWCAFDQDHLVHAPYDWCQMERRLGLLRRDGTPKPMLHELRHFGAFLEKLPFKNLPRHATEAVCVLTEAQDQWAAAFSAFILAKQAGFDLRFQTADQPLVPAPLYLLPSVSSQRALTRRAWLALLDRVRRGATLYLSAHDAFLDPFDTPLGLEVLSRERRVGPAEITMAGIKGNPTLPVAAALRWRLHPCGATVLASESDGNPVFTCARWGRGRIYFLALPLELELARQPSAFHGAEAPPYWQVYRQYAAPLLRRRVVRKEHPQVGLTEHALDRSSRVVVQINYSPEDMTVPLRLAAGWRVAKVLRGEEPRTNSGASQAMVRLLANDAAVYVVRRRS